jgi:hypothetical protein
MRRRAKPAKAKVKAKPPVARGLPEDQGSRVRDLEQRLAESLEREKATSEILRVIRRSPTEVQRVFEIIGKQAEKLSTAEISLVSRVDGEQIRLAALHGVMSPPLRDRIDSMGSTWSAR